MQRLLNNASNLALSTDEARAGPARARPARTSVPHAVRGHALALAVWHPVAQLARVQRVVRREAGRIRIGGGRGGVVPLALPHGAAWQSPALKDADPLRAAACDAALALPRAATKAADVHDSVRGAGLLAFALQLAVDERAREARAVTRRQRASNTPAALRKDADERDRATCVAQRASARGGARRHATRVHAAVRVRDCGDGRGAVACAHARSVVLCAATDVEEQSHGRRARPRPRRARHAHATEHPGRADSRQSMRRRRRRPADLKRVQPHS